MRRKVYGASKQESCVICGGAGTSKNSQGIPVCKHHVREEVNLLCVCKEYLDVRQSKYGTFFVCINCGPVSYSKALEVNDLPVTKVEDL